MASRTNKKGIAAKKAQIEKQARRMKGQKRFNYPKRKISLADAKEIGIVGAKANPAGREYHWFLKGRKICWETGLRIDPDGYRFIVKPSGGSEFVEVPVSGWVRKKIAKNNQRK